MKNIHFPIGACLASLLMALPTQAETTTDEPVFHKYSFSDAGIVMVMSDNGQWGLSTYGTSDNSSTDQAKLVEIATGEYTTIRTDDDVTSGYECSANDVTDDGEIVVGSYQGLPAYWTKSTLTWTTLELPEANSSGYVFAVTPDGLYGVGAGEYSSSIYPSDPLMWDLTTGELIELPNLPTLDMTHEEQGQARAKGVSPDGRYVLVDMSYSYAYPASLCVYVYDRENESAEFIGFTASDTRDWTPDIDDLYYCTDPYMSTSGEWVAVNAYMVTDDTEYYVPARYNVLTGEFTAYTDTESEGMGTFAIDNDGNILGCSPYQSTPLREWYVRYGDFWYSIDLILSQNFGIDYYSTTNYDYTGTPMAVSSDSKTILVMVDPTGESYAIDLPDTPTSLCDGVNLLADYSVSPADGSVFTYINIVEVTFDRDVEVKGSTSDIKLLNSSGTSVRAASGFAVSTSDSKTVVITFRPTQLTEGETYTITIPEGAVCISGDNSKVNDSIVISYTGRANTAVQPIYIYPSDGAELAKIDNSSNAVLVEYDAYVAVSDTASAALYRIDEDGTTTICELSVMASDDYIAIYPTSTQYLYLDQTYKVVLGAGSVTDISGTGGNEELSLTYYGTYERQLSYDDETLFSDDFSDPTTSLTTFMRYEGDGLEPTDAMAEWGFDADSYPWSFYLRDDTSSDDWCAGTHSMYDPAGQSDDWLVIPQLQLPDEYCTLSFKAQSYLEDKEDTLTVYVWASEENYSVMTSSTIELIKTEGTIVFQERLYPGEEEDLLEGDWVDYTVDLGAFGDQYVYIAFANLNTDQSAMFVDDILVKRSLKYLMSLSNESSVVNKDSITIKGKITNNSDDDVYSTIKLTLNDGDGNEVSTIEVAGLEFAKDSVYAFEFPTALPLTIGETNRFTIGVALDDYTDEISSSVKDLTFTPTRRVVLEEMTGTTCVNCPLGILAIEKLEETYGEQFIPISLHTYTGDPYESGMTDYSDHLGLSAAPSGIINRNGNISYPMEEDPATAEYIFSNGEDLWMDYVAAEFETPVDMDITATATYDETAGTFSVDCTVTSAVNLRSQNLNIFMVIVEDGIVSYQENCFYNVDDDNLGEWGKGGKYASSIVYNITHNDVARACWGSGYDGASGLLPQALTANEAYTIDGLSDLDIPDNLEDVSNCKAIVMIFDENTETAVNSVSTPLVADATGIRGISTDEGEAETSFYTISGVKLQSLSGYKGTVIVKTIRDGKATTKKVIVK